MGALNALIILSIAFISLVYYAFRRFYSYWESKGIPYVEPAIPYGNIKGVGKDVHISKFTQNVYKQMKGKDQLCGVYLIYKPAAILLDLNLIKSVLIKDFNNFNERGMYFNEKDDPLSAHLFSLDGKTWKNLRNRLSPTFTSGKMKFMYPTIIDVAENFKNCMREVIKENDEVEIKELLARFTTDVIGTCAFGIECNSLKDPNAEFRVMGKKVFDEPRNIPIINFFLMTFRNLGRILRMKITRDDVTEFFLKVVNETITFREKNNIHRNDFMDLLIKLKNESHDGNGESKLSINEIAAQAFLFFLAGFETSSTTMTFCLYELAINKDVQEKARQEIRSVLKKHNGKFTYEAMMDMHYIDQVINETLRKYPPVTILNRNTVNDYKVPDSKHVLEKDTLLWIPVYAIQHDPEYYPDPEAFKPERFAADQVANRDTSQWLPFGEGPRNCVGLRFGMMQTRVGLVTLLNNFEFSLCSKSTVPLTFINQSFILAPEGGVWLKINQI